MGLFVLKRLIIILNLLLANFIIGQPVNLIPNPSFEILTQSCALLSGSSISNATGWFQPNGQPGQPLNGGSTDLYLACNYPTLLGTSTPWNISGFQYARTGGNYAGADIANYNSNSWLEYLEVGLSDTLKNGRKYCVSWYWSRAGGHQNIYYYNVKTDAMQAVFTSDTLRYNSPTYNLIQIPPSVKNPSGNILGDTISWNLFSQTYTANGNERFMTIGNFLDFSQNIYVDYTIGSDEGAYYFFDDFSIYQLPELTASNDTTICVGDPIQLNVTCDGCWQGNKLVWKDEQGNVLGQTNSIIIQPDQTGTYYVNLIDTTNLVPCVSEIIDSVTIIVNGAIVSVDAGQDISACVGDTVVIGSVPKPNATYSWSPQVNIVNPNSSQSLLVVHQPQSYTLTQISVSQNCSYTSFDTVSVSLKPEVGALINSGDTSLCNGNQLTISTSVNDNINLNWTINGVSNFSQDSSLNLSVDSSLAIILFLSDTTNSYCIIGVSDTIFVTAIDCDTSFNVFVPNIFSPNNDNINDVFEVEIKNGEVKIFEIYNRWGVKIYELNNDTSGNPVINKLIWDGKTTSGIDCTQGTYFYVLEVKNTQNTTKTFRGFLNLVK